jgi:hypothetical protein
LVVIVVVVAAAVVIAAAGAEHVAVLQVRRDGGGADFDGVGIGRIAGGDVADKDFALIAFALLVGLQRGSDVLIRLVGDTSERTEADRRCETNPTQGANHERYSTAASSGVA